MATQEIVAVDGGQDYSMLLGESDTLVWRANNLSDGDSLASAAYSIDGTAITAAEAFLTSPDVGYRITAAEVGTAIIEVTLNTASGDVKKHRLTVDVAVTMEREATSLVVEDGTGTEPTANSYANHTDLVTYAADRGTDLSTYSVAKLDALMFKAMDYIESKRKRFQGTKATSTQPLQWPRTGVCIDGIDVGSTEIPLELKHAQLSLAIEAIDNDLQATVLPVEGGAVIRERVEGAVDVSYAAPNAGQSRQPKFTAAEALLSVLYKPQQMFAIRA